MTVPTIFDTCRPRADVLTGAMTEVDFAADLAQVIRGEGHADYLDPERFFANTHPTRGLKNLLANVCRRLTGAGGEVASIFRLDTTYGGGKSHGLIALCHAARACGACPVSRSLLIPRCYREARYASPPSMARTPIRPMVAGWRTVSSRTPPGRDRVRAGRPGGYARVRASDERRIAPGAETLRELFGGKPTLSPAR